MSSVIARSVPLDARNAPVEHQDHQAGADDPRDMDKRLENLKHQHPHRFRAALPRSPFHELDRAQNDL
jgi:hypothetical protein